MDNSQGLQEWLVHWVRVGLQENGWSQADLAELVGLTEKHLSQLLTGKAGGTLGTWDALLTAVGVRERALL